MLKEIAIGDAYGAAFEFAPKEFANENNDLKYHAHPTRKDKIGPGEYTDDTQMSVALVELMLSDQHISPLNIADSFVSTFKANPIDGYARGFQSILEKCEDGASLLRQIDPNSKRNGSVMRAVPVGLLPTSAEVIHFAALQSSVTHATQIAIDSSTFISLMAHYFYYKLGETCEVLEWMKGLNVLPVNEIAFQDIAYQPIRCEAAHTASAVHYLMHNTFSMSHILLDAIRMGGDTDSVAAVALGLASLSGDFPNDLPLHLYTELQGMETLLELDRKVLDRYAN